jgi:hypothetical protein
MGRNNAAFHNITFSKRVDDEDWLVIEANHPELGKVGTMWLGPADSNKFRTVGGVDVPSEHRRKGVATSMWKYAKDSGLNPKHDYVEQTDEGKAWAKQVGD